jgi:hypothetical protein
MREGWSLVALKDHVRDRGGDRRDFTIDVLDSIGRSNAILAYHVDAVKRSVDGLLHDDKGSAKCFDFLFGLCSEPNNQNYECRQATVVNEAHLIAAINTIRSAVDMLAQVINELALEDRFPIEKVYVNRVLNRLPDSDLKTRLAGLHGSHWFKYVTGFINTSKHRNLVEQRFSISLERRLAGIRMSEFEYDETPFDDYWDHEILDGILDVADQLIHCGQALNAHCIPQK